MGMSDVMKPDPSFFVPFQDMIDASIAAAELGDLSEAQVQAIVDAAVGVAEADDLTEEDVQALIDAAIAAVGGGGGSSVLYVFEEMTSGDVAIPQAAGFSAFTAAHDLVIAAEVGDVIEVGLSALITYAASAADFTMFDFATRVAGAPVHFVGTGNVAFGSGFGGWFTPNNGQFASIGGSSTYVVQAGDIEDGNVTLRLYYATSGGAGNRTVRANGVDKARWWVKRTHND